MLNKKDVEKKINWKNVSKPTLAKVIVVIVILVGLYFYFTYIANKFSYAGPSLEKIEEFIIGQIFRNTLLLGIPLAIITWILIGLIEERFRKK